MIYDIAIIGGGYGGLVLAISCARAGLLVCLIEKNDKLGRKILSTGNGRCNFTNTDMDWHNFYSSADLSALRIDYQASVDFLNSCGVAANDNKGYYYPMTNAAATVREALASELDSYKNVTVFLNETAADISKKSENFIVKTDKRQIESMKLCLATGGKSQPKLGSSGDGHKFASKLGLKLRPTAPALVGLNSEDKRLKNLAGVRAIGRCKYKDTIFEGEVQFNKDSISGFPVMCLSRQVSLDLKLGQNCLLVIDTVPYMTEAELLTELTGRAYGRCAEKGCYYVLLGLVNEKIIDTCLKDLRISDNTKGGELSKKQLNAICRFLKGMEFTISSTKGYESSQVTAGGVDLSEINLETMEVNKPELKGLYIIGELLDVDGICGGYNLEWARYSADCAYRDIINDSNKSV